MTSTESRLTGLRTRASGLGVDPVPVLGRGPRVSGSGAGEAWTTLALSIDGYRAAAEDEWPDDVLAAVGDLSGSNGGGPLDPRSIRSLLPLGPEELRGHVSRVKGRVFENHVADTTEDLDLPDGADGIRLADSIGQPGWDGELTADDQVVGVVQMKATESLRAVTDHLDRYPDIDAVVVTSNLAEPAAAAGIPVIDSGIDLADLTADTADALDSLGLSSAVMEILPAGALGVLVLRAAVKMRQGESTTTVGRWLIAEAGPLATLQVLGLAAEIATGAIGVRVAVTAGGRLVHQRYRVARDARTAIIGCEARVRTMLDIYAAGGQQPVRHRAELPFRG